MACLCCRCVADRFASDSGRCAFLRPASKVLCVAITAHFGQKWLPRRRICFPEPGQSASGFGISTAGRDGRPLACLRCCCVNREAGTRLRAAFDRFVVDQSVRATYSAHGARSFLHVSAVLLNCEAKLDIKRTQPFAVSKKSDLRNGSWVIHWQTQFSNCGLTGSTTSSARESRLGVSACRPTLKPGSRPSAVRASLDSDSRTL